MEELKRTLFELLRGKTPRMDGFVVEFYRLNRESIGEGLLKAVNTLAIIAEFTIEVESNKNHINSKSENPNFTFPVHTNQPLQHHLQYFGKNV